MNKNLQAIAAALLATATLTGVAFAFTVTDAEKIGAISKKMSEVTSDIAMAQIKYDSLALERSQIDNKLSLVQNHIDEQNKAISSYKLEIQQIIKGEVSNQITYETCYFDNDRFGFKGLQGMFEIKNGETCDESAERKYNEKQSFTQPLNK